MNSKALGLIEVKGYLGAVLAADAALKAANVRLVKIEKIKGALTTVMLDGDVGAVSAAVDAGAAAVTGIATLISSHVIPRMHEETEMLVRTPVPQKTEELEECHLAVDPGEQKEEELVPVQLDEQEEIHHPEQLDEQAENHAVEMLDTQEGYKAKPAIEKARAESLTAILPDSSDLPKRVQHRERMIVGGNSVNPDLQRKSVQELRTMVRKLRIPGVKPASIKYSKKEELIVLISNHYRKEDK
ncbi:BMC domain-containing protein [Mesobacillus zeae]|uniref:BMC domain-containing protein n=1 Tax=Mesobacillus zeae TaxID=1917180 RepID=A0A398BFL2_9BACI|nr:BMC domain-containing protein [Mesobacillus zeae]RID86343.1 BMC domain-containing protein [Mesobacillus zeae]